MLPGRRGGCGEDIVREGNKEKVQLQSHQRPLQAGGVVVASAHDQDTFLLVELGGQLLDLLIQTQHLLYQIYTEIVRKCTMSLFVSSFFFFPNLPSLHPFWKTINNEQMNE